MFIVVKISFYSIVCDEQVRPSVIVIIRSSHRKVFSFGLKHVHRACNVGECAVGIIVVKSIHTSFVCARRTAALQTSNIAISRTIGIQSDIASDIKIQVAIAIVVEKRGATVKVSRLFAGNSRLIRHVLKRATAVVVVENISAGLRNEQIGKPVIVIVAPDAAQSVAGPGHSNFFGHVRESAVRVIVVKSIANRNSATVQVTTVDEVNILPTIAIEVTHTNSRPKFLAIDGNSIIAFEVDKLDAGRIRDIRKADRTRFRYLGEDVTPAKSGAKA